jgi:cytochrome c5
MKPETELTFARAAAAALVAWLIAALLAMASFAAPLRAQANATAAPKTVQQGVFSAAQAKRGEALYGANCARCHEGADVDGPSLVGDPFIDRWREDTLDNLYTFIHTRMPGDAPGTLEGAAYLEILAYLLS